MRIVHTGDIHLREVGDERWLAFKAIADLCAVEEVDLLVIAGDLFDTSTGAEQLRADLREVFSGTHFHTVVIPGNHDVNAYQPGYFFGRGVTFFNDDNPLKNFHDTEGARIIGLPFRDRDSFEMARLLRELQSALDPDKQNIVVYHGELLDAFYSREDFGPEGARRHMPAKLSHFKELGVDYVLAGHFHTHFRVWSLGPDSYFVYAGSPISITRKETGQRCVNLFEIGSEPRDHPLDTMHYHQLHITFDPGEDADPVQLVADRIEGIHASAKIMLTLDGYVTRDEDQIVEKVGRLLEAKQHDEPSYLFRDVSRILNHPLFSLINDRVDHRELDMQTADQLWRLFLRAMTEAHL